ncbi:hypothetical protein CAPTEDRAFT_138705 [Capitella teleta]|uniref:Uncharacterized protein n=1 Tax=Capitella teleta TaxID=283909 RepID=R7VCW2_CAPTE|nr:hypothetical protein CAPTEDRAFT_113908 [Capitella teleta]ELU16407.1 hypothetical protein CAPTEDRAFT_138705 [Capitella teleta]|eukprot:ELU06515.1 hypothetical protein CAPTEDRAFT_113908 [Capitella teleta]
MSITSTEKEILCAVHWFQSWSAMQKGDFMKDLLEKAVPQKVSTLFGAFESLNMQDSKPPSIFKCQLKLFSDWFAEWSDKDRNDFMRKLEEVDHNFVDQFNIALANTAQQP